jgi:hypothetical protein
MGIRLARGSLDLGEASDSRLSLDGRAGKVKNYNWMGQCIIVDSAIVFHLDARRRMGGRVDT